MDRIDKERRSRLMAKIRGRDTSPEILVRKSLFAANAVSGTLRGCQIGLVNYAERVDRGCQIGLVNIISRNGWMPVFPIVNGSF